MHMVQFDGVPDSAYRLAETRRFLERVGKVSRIDRRKPTGKPMLRGTARANAKKSAVRAHVEHPFRERRVDPGMPGAPLCTDTLFVRIPKG